MPITGLFSCCAFVGLLLLAPAMVTSVILLVAEKKRAALAVLCVPVGMVGVSILLTFLVFAAAERYSRSMSAQPDLLFRMTFDFIPPPDTSVLEAYHQSLIDYATTVLEFRASQEVIDRITSRGFTRADQATFLRRYESNKSNLPEEIRSWFHPAREADQFYLATQFDRSFARNEAILSYNEKTQAAYFHWVGVD